MNCISFSRSTSLYFLYSSVKRTVFCKSSGCLLTNKSSRLFLSTEYFPTEKVKSLKQDTLLYTLDKTKLVRYITIYGIGQFAICMFLGFNVFFSLKDTGSSKISKNTSDSDEKYWRKMNLGDVKYRIMSGMACCGIGLIVGLVCYYLPTRIVKLITLQKGGSTAVIVTYGPFGKTRSLKVPLHLLTCTVSRDQAKSYIPIKIKKKWFFYLIDCNGQFHQPALFDVTVGAKNW